MQKDEIKYADLHVHTFYSDSTFSPEEVVSRANEKGLAAIAICDHDCIDGIEPCRKLGDKTGLEIIPGIELTVEKIEAEAHILGYFIDWKLGWFQKRLKAIQAARVDRIHRMVEKLKDLGIDLDAKEVFKLAGKGSVGRLHLAKTLLKNGKIRDIREAFDKYIGFNKPCYISNVRFSPREAIEMIIKTGGVPVLAHPYVLRKDECITEFIEYGLRGIEAYHPEQKGSIAKRYESLAEKYKLLVTGGSDCHGLGKGYVLLGSVKVPYSVVEKLRAESERIRSGNA